MRNIYRELKTNNTTVKLVILACIIICVSSFYMVYKATQDKDKILYVITENGNVLPLNRIESKEDELNIVKSNIAYFVDQYYTLDQFNYQSKAEKVLWLAGNDFQKMYKDKQAKGYFNRFVQTGAIQKAKVVDESIKILNTESPYNVSYDVIIDITNGGNTQSYIVTNTATIYKVNINYPYNPFGLLMSNFVETNLKLYSNPN